MAELEKTEFEFPDEIEAKKTKDFKEEPEIEIVDDTTEHPCKPHLKSLLTRS